MKLLETCGTKPLAFKDLKLGDVYRTVAGVIRMKLTFTSNPTAEYCVDPVSGVAYVSSGSSSEFQVAEVISTAALVLKP